MASRMALALMVVLALAATGCTSGGAGPAQAVTPPLAPPEGITVTGAGRVTGQPDTLSATIGVEVVQDTVQEALDTANTAAEAVFAALREAGVDEDDIQTVDVTVEPRYNYETDPPPITGYIVRNLVRVRLRDLGRAGEILQTAVATAGDAARVQHLEFALEDNEALLADARAKAFADARAKAEQYAELADRSLGTLVSVSEGISTPPPPQPFSGDETGAARAEAAIPIQPGQQEVQVTVTTVWSLR